MKPRLPSLLLLALLCVSVPAFAIVARLPKKADDPVFTCSAPSFTLTKDQNGLHLQGQVQVPTAGWTYSIEEEEPGPDGSLHATLHMQEPGGVGAEVISQVAVDHVFTGEGDRLTVMTDGLKQNLTIECKAAGPAQ